MNELLKVMMSESGPVMIDAMRWPMVANVGGYLDESTSITLLVRQHETTGRRIVCAERWASGRLHSYAGFLLTEEDAICMSVATAKAVRRAAGRVGAPASLTDEIIENLPPVAI